MNILMLTPYLPYPLHSGGQIRTYNLLKKLSHKHKITLCALIKDEKEKEFIPMLSEFCDVKVFKRSATPFTLKNIFNTAFSSYPFLVIRNHVKELKDYLTKELQNPGAYDLIHAETFYMMPHLPKTSIPVLLAEQTIEYLGYESYAARAFPLIRPMLHLDIAKLRRWEHFFWNDCQQLIVMSDEDKEFVQKRVSDPKKVDVVANGVDSAWFAERKRNEAKNPTVLFVGTFRWLPNVEAVEFLAKKVWPLVIKKLPAARLNIVGAHPGERILDLQKEESITVIGNIPDIRDAFNTAHALAAPVFSGKGTRYKILEGLASGTPVVATSTAVEGLSIQPGIHALVEDDAESFANTLLKLLQSKQLQDKLRKNGLSYVKEHFDWQNIAQELDEIYYRMGKQHEKT